MSDGAVAGVAPGVHGDFIADVVGGVEGTVVDGVLGAAFLGKHGAAPLMHGFDLGSAGGYDAIVVVIAESPIRPHLCKQDICPLWIPRVHANYLVVTCAECLRSSSIADSTMSEESPGGRLPCLRSPDPLSGGLKHPQGARTQEKPRSYLEP